MCVWPSPVGQAKYKEFKEGWVYEQTLVIVVELSESGEPLGPATRHLHGAGEDAVEKLNLLSLG